MLIILLLLSLPTPALAGSIAMTWTADDPMAAQFHVYTGQGTGRCSDVTDLSLRLATTTEKAYIDTTVTDGSLRCYEVTAFNSTAESAHSNRVVKAVPMPPPAPPSGFWAWLKSLFSWLIIWN